MLHMSNAKLDELDDTIDTIYIGLVFHPFERDDEFKFIYTVDKLERTGELIVGHKVGHQPRRVFLRRLTSPRCGTIGNRGLPLGQRADSKQWTNFSSKSVGEVMLRMTQGLQQNPECCRMACTLQVALTSNHV